MNLLCLETSTQKLSLAVTKNGSVLRSRNKKFDRPLDRSIMPAIRRILKEAGMTLNRLEGFVVGLGPGSFTGLRVGLATVKGLAFATGKPVIGVPSLDVIAMNVRADGRVCVMGDARRGLIYTCLYEKSGKNLKRRSDYRLVPVDEALKGIKGEVTFVGDGLKVFREEIERVKRITPVFADEGQFAPQARWMAPLVEQRASENKWDDPDRLVPLYLYPDHCQIKKKEKVSA